MKNEMPMGKRTPGMGTSQGTPSSDSNALRFSATNLPYLKNPEQPQIVDDAKDQPRRLPTAERHGQHREIVGRRRIEQQQHVKRVQPAIKDIGGQQQPRQTQSGILDCKVDAVEEQKEGGKCPALVQHRGFATLWRDWRRLSHSTGRAPSSRTENRWRHGRSRHPRSRDLRPGDRPSGSNRPASSRHRRATGA